MEQEEGKEKKEGGDWPSWDHTAHIPFHVAWPIFDSLYSACRAATLLCSSLSHIFSPMLSRTTFDPATLPASCVPFPHHCALRFTASASVQNSRLTLLQLAGGSWANNPCQTAGMAGLQVIGLAGRLLSWSSILFLPSPSVLLIFWSGGWDVQNASEPHRLGDAWLYFLFVRFGFVMALILGF